jgi:hypothetical protein
MNSLCPNLSISHDWEYRYASVGQIPYINKKGRGMYQKTSQYLVGPFASCSATSSHSWSGCWLWNVVPLLFNGCAKILAIGGNWNTLSYTSIHPQWVTSLVRMQAVEEFIFQELCTDPCDMDCTLLCWNMRWWRRDNRPQNLLTVSLCIQIAIDKMPFCSLSIAYSCPYHNPPTMGHSVHISKPQVHMTPSARYRQTGIHL